MLDVEGMREGSAIAPPEVKILDFEMIFAMFGRHNATINGAVARQSFGTDTVPFKLGGRTIALRSADLKCRQKSLQQILLKAIFEAVMVEILRCERDCKQKERNRQQ